MAARVAPAAAGDVGDPIFWAARRTVDWGLTMHRMRNVPFLVVLLFVLSGVDGIAAQPVPVEKTCALSVPEHWTPQEKFVWTKVCAGEVADFTTAPDFGNGDDAKSSKDFPPSRILSSAFLETILLSDTYRSRLTRRGVHVEGARFKDTVDLENAEIRHELRLVNCQLDGGVNFAGLTSTRGITLSNDRIRPKTEDGVSIRLEWAQIQGSVDLSGSKIAGEVHAHTIEIGQAIYLNAGAAFDKDIDISYAKIGKSLNLAGATFLGDVKLDGTQIGADLNLADRHDGSAKWGRASILDLHNASADRIPPLSAPWPPKLKLNGFTYRSIELSPQDNLIPLSSIRKWFEKQKDYSAQSYEQLAQVFQSHGAKEAATNIRYAGKDRERQEANQGWRESLWLTSLYVLIGYGYYPEQAIWLIAGIVFLGAIVLRLSGEGRANGLPYGIAYSFDMLLPIIKLREKHYDIDLKSWARYYFYGHRIAGWVLASFLVAGLSGLAK